MHVRKAHAYCTTLPGATLDVKWAFEDSAHPVYSVGGRMFAMFSTKSGVLVDTLMFKADDARFLELTDREGIVPAPYLAKAKWVMVERLSLLSDGQLKQLLDEAHAVILAKLSKRKQAAILAGAAPGAQRPSKVAKSAATKVAR